MYARKGAVQLLRYLRVDVDAEYAVDGIDNPCNLKRTIFHPKRLGQASMLQYHIFDARKLQALRWAYRGRWKY
jgi:hypothetical protein